MQLKHLISKLGPSRPDLFWLPAPTAQIFGTRLLLEGEEPREPDLLYVCDRPRFSQLDIRPEQRGNFLVCGASELSQSLAPGVNVVLLPGEGDPLPVYNRLLDYFLMEQRLAEGMKVLASGLFHNQGLQHLVDVAYTVLKNPIFVSDATNKYVAAVYDESFVKPGSQYENFIFNDILYSYVDEGGQSYIKELNLDDILAQTDTPYCIYHSRFEADAMFSSIRAHNVMVGKIFMVGLEHPFTPLDYQYFRRLVELVNQELQKDDSVVRNRYENEALFLVDLLTSSHADPEMLRRCLSAFKFIPQSKLFMGVFQPKNQAMNSDSLTILRSQLKGLLPSHPLAVLDGRLVVLFNLAANRTLGQYLWDQLGDFTRRNQMIMGLSSQFGDLSQVPRYYEQAIEAVRLGQTFLPERHIFRFSDVSVQELLSRYHQSGDLSALVRPEIQALAEHDRKNGTEYLQTLSVYLEHMGNSQAVSEVLHIHKNTLLYRVNKLSEHFALDLTSGSRVLEYQLSLRILDALPRLNQRGQE